MEITIKQLSNISRALQVLTTVMLSEPGSVEENIKKNHLLNDIEYSEVRKLHKDINARISIVRDSLEL